MGATVDLQSTKYDCCDEQYPDITFIFQLQRSSPAYRALMVLPCLGMSNLDILTCSEACRSMDHDYYPPPPGKNKERIWKDVEAKEF